MLHVDHCARCQAVVAQFAEAADCSAAARARASSRRPASRPARSPALGARSTALAPSPAGRGRGRRGDGGDPEHHHRARRRVEHRRRADRSRWRWRWSTRRASCPPGWAYVTDGQSVAVSVDYGIPDGEYTVRADPAVGAAADLGTMTVTGGRGSFTGKSPEPLTPGIHDLTGGLVGTPDMSRNRRLTPLRFGRLWNLSPGSGSRKARQDMRRLWILMAAVLAFGGLALVAPVGGRGIEHASSAPTSRRSALEPELSNAANLKSSGASRSASEFKTAAKHASGEGEEGDEHHRELHRSHSARRTPPTWPRSTRATASRTTRRPSAST